MPEVVQAAKGKSGGRLNLEPITRSARKRKGVQKKLMGFARKLVRRRYRSLGCTKQLLRSKCKRQPKLSF
jgi:hypothetical protein